MIVIADASPLTALLHLKKLELLIELYGRIIIPKAVALELNSLTAFGYNLSFLTQTEAYSIVQSSNLQFMELLQQHLDAGES